MELDLLKIKKYLELHRIQLKEDQIAKLAHGEKSGIIPDIRLKGGKVDSRLKFVQKGNRLFVEYYPVNNKAKTDIASHVTKLKDDLMTVQGSTPEILEKKLKSIGIDVNKLPDDLIYGQMSLSKDRKQLSLKSLDPEKFYRELMAKNMVVAKLHVAKDNDLKIETRHIDINIDNGSQAVIFQTQNEDQQKEVLHKLGLNKEHKLSKQPVEVTLYNKTTDQYFKTNIMLKDDNISLAKVKSDDAVQLKDFVKSYSQQELAVKNPEASRATNKGVELDKASLGMLSIDPARQLDILIKNLTVALKNNSKYASSIHQRLSPGITRLAAKRIKHSNADKELKEKLMNALGYNKGKSQGRQHSKTYSHSI